MIVRASRWRSPMTAGIGALGFAGTAVVVSLLAQTPDLPGAYPRPGATKVLENDRIVVWDISWLKQQYPLHRHRYDLAGVYYSPGDRMIIGQDGSRRPVTTKAWDTAFQRSGVTHVEEGASDPPLRALFLELKEQTPSGKVDTTNTPTGFAAIAGMSRSAVAGVLVVITAVAVLSGQAENLQVGTWKMNIAKSQADPGPLIFQRKVLRFPRVGEVVDWPCSLVLGLPCLYWCLGIRGLQLD